MRRITKYIILALLLISGNVFAQSDSLSYYLELAATNNPLLKSEFSLYKASLQKIPQAGAYTDPQLEMGFFIKPMEILDGKQVADFKLMQMFPWFGTRKAARNEATEMARMSFEKFRETRDQLFFDVKSTWYLLANLQQRLNTVRENRTLLTVLKDLVTGRFSAPGGQSKAARSASNSTLPAAENIQATSGGMSGMNSMGGPKSATTATTGSTPQSTGMGQMSGGSGMNNSSGGMSDVLRVQLELLELENEEQDVISEMTTAVAKFNALLNREATTQVMIPQTLVKREFLLDDQSVMELIKQQNPMLGMVTAEAEAYKAKLEMDKKMGMPMWGIGLQYSLISKRMDMGIPVTSMNGKDMVMPMVSLSIPIYRKKYSAQQKESRFMRQAAEEKYEGTLHTLSSEYVSVKQQLADAGRKIRLYEEQAQLALTTYQLAIKEFSAGTSGMTNVLEVQRQLLNYQFKRSEAIATFNTIVAMIENLLSEPQTN